MMPTLENRLYYLAALIDGEGHISATLQHRPAVPRKDGTPGSQMRYQVGITNTDMRIIEEVESVVAALGIKSQTFAINHKQRSRKPCWVVRFDGIKRVQAILSVNAPYLIAKRDRAELLLALMRHRLATQDVRPALGPRSLPEDDQWLMNALGELRHLNGDRGREVKTG